MDKVNEDKNLGYASSDLETEQGVHRAVETYPMPKHGWTCFHCGETFTTIGNAEDHFGKRPENTPACRIKLGDERGLVMQLRKVEASRDEWMDEALRGRNEIEALECRVESLTTDMRSYKPFRECDSIRDVFFVYDSVEGRAIAAEARINAPDQTPECLSINNRMAHGQASETKSV